jgi:hypothetical protein
MCVANGLDLRTSKFTGIEWILWRLKGIVFFGVWVLGPTHNALSPLTLRFCA